MCDVCILLYDSVNVFLFLIDVKSILEFLFLRVKRLDSIVKFAKFLILDNDDKFEIVLFFEISVD